MAITRFHTVMSIDGYITGPDHAMDWVFRQGDGTPVPEAEEVRVGSGAIIGGRSGYDALADNPDVPPQAQRPFGGDWEGAIFVLTHRPVENPHPDYTFLNCDVREAVATALDAAGGKDVLILSSDIAGQALRAGVLDEILLHVAPVVLGDGTRLFDFPGGAEIQLERTQLSDAGGLTTIRLRPVRDA